MNRVTDKARKDRERYCIHVVKRLPVEAMPYKYECTKCGRLLRLASGIVIK